jgi:general secretion pathway protein G
MPVRSQRLAPRWSALARGFTLVEMLIVAALIGLLAGIALPNYRNAQRKARESVLRENLWILRDLVDQHKSDKGVYPESLQDLVDKGYVRRVPVDPITNSAETWIEIREEVAQDAPEEEDVDTGIQDVQSGATGQTLDGVPYSEL